MKFIQKFVELCRDEDGAMTIEYVLLAVATVALAGVGALKVATYVSGLTVA